MEGGEDSKPPAMVGESGENDGDDDAKGSSPTKPVNPHPGFFEKPDPMDIICGRGKSGPHPGNQRFQKIIMKNRVAYLESKRREDKSRITHTIVDELTKSMSPPSR